MHVLIVGPFPEDLDVPLGGVQAATANLVAGLVKLPDVQIEVISVNTIPDERRVSHPFGTVTYIPQRPGFRGWAKDLHVHLIHEARRRKADVVHVQGLASVAAHLPGSVLTVHGILERDIWVSGEGLSRVIRFGGALLFEGIPRRTAGRVIAVSEYVGQQVGRCGSRVWNIPNAIAARYFSGSRQVCRGNPNVFVQAGQISPIKNNAEVIVAFRRVVEANQAALLLVAGGGLDTRYGRQCADLVDRLHLQQHVTFLGQQTSAQVAELLYGAGTLVQYSTQENAPVAVAEALAAGAAVVGSDAGGIPGMLRGLPGCHVVPTGDLGSLADRLMASTVSEDEMFSRRRHEAALRYSPRAVSEQTLSVYHEVAGSSVSQLNGERKRHDWE